MLIVAAYAYFGVKYQNPNWVFSPPNVLRHEGRTYHPSNFAPMDTPPAKRGYNYTQIKTLHPFGQPILGLDGASLQMNLYLEWHGKYEAYGILGGP